MIKYKNTVGTHFLHSIDLYLGIVFLISLSSNNFRSLHLKTLTLLIMNRKEIAQRIVPKKYGQHIDDLNSKIVTLSMELNKKVRIRLLLNSIST